MKREDLRDLRFYLRVAHEALRRARDVNNRLLVPDAALEDMLAEWSINLEERY